MLEISGELEEGRIASGGIRSISWQHTECAIALPTTETSVTVEGLFLGLHLTLLLWYHFEVVLSYFFF